MTDKQTNALKFALKVLNDCHHYINDAFAAYAALEAALAEQQEQMKRCMEHGECFGGECIYTSPQQHIEHCLWARNGNQPCPHVQSRQWQGLTDEEIDYVMARENPHCDEERFARAIEAKLKEKNSG